MTPPTRARAANLIYVEFTSEDELRNGNAKCAARGAAGTAKAAVIRQRNLEEIRSQAALIQQFDKLNVSRRPKKEQK